MMLRLPGQLLASLPLIAATFVYAQAPAPWSATGRLQVSNADADDHLGPGGALMGPTLAISRDGSTMAVGAPDEDSAARGVDGDQTDNEAYAAGAVYVLARNGEDWVQQAYLKASNTDLGDGFGFAVALSADGSTLAVGANYEDSAADGIDGDQSDNSAYESGAVYVFARNAGRWSQQAYIKPSDTDEADRYGFSVALSDDGATLAVGAIGEDSAATTINGDDSDNSAADAGAVYVYARDNGDWSQQAYLKASNAEAGDLYGFCVALSGDGDTLGVCGFDEDSSAELIGGDQADNRARGSGAAYVLERSGTAWSQTAYIKASNTAMQGAFGTALALSRDGNTMAVCACDEDGMDPGVGAPQWQADIPPYERTRAVEGSAGAVYVYRRQGPTWAFDTYIKSSNIGANDIFGSRLALSDDGTVLVAAAPQETGGGRGINPPDAVAPAPESGAVYIFSRDSRGWRQDAYVKADDAAEYDSFGSGLALTGDGRELAVTAPNADGSGGLRDAGAIYLFTRSATPR
jgi:hypothetical protein